MDPFKRKNFSGILLASLLSTSLMAETNLPEMSDIEAAWQSGDFVSARQGLEKLASQTDSPLAHYRYGRILLEGKGGVQDSETALLYLRKAVQGGSGAAATLLARVVLTNARTDAAFTEAVGLFTFSAAKGDKEAKYYLGLLAREGRGMPKDLTISYGWFLAAAEDQYVPAQYEVSRALSRGEGAAQDTKKALFWLKEAAAGGHTEAQFFLAHALSNGQGARKDEAQANQWYLRAAEGGHTSSQRIIGTAYLLGGAGVPQDGASALKWLTVAASKDDVRAMSNLAYGFATGTGFDQNDAKALEWYHKASKDEYGPATLALARFYETGRAVDADLVKAVSLYQRAIKEGAENAAIRLGVLAIEGKLKGLAAPHSQADWVLAAGSKGETGAEDWLREQAAQNIRPAQANLARLLMSIEGRTAEAVPYLQQAGQAGDVPSQFQLGELYSTGRGVPHDYVQAHAWLNIAAGSGHPEAAETRDVIANLMTKDQVADAQSITRDFFENVKKYAPGTAQDH